MPNSLKYFMRSLLLLLPLVVGIAVISYVTTGNYTLLIGQAGADKLITQNWQTASDQLAAVRPKIERRYANYQIQENQTLEKIAAHFSVAPERLRQLNPRTFTPGTTIKIPLVEKPLVETAGPNGLLSSARISVKGKFIRVSGDFEDRQIVTSLPELADFLADYQVIEQVGDKRWRILKPLSIEKNIRLDLTPATVTRLELSSDPDNISCLCFENAQALIKAVEISSFDSSTGGPDYITTDGRSYVRARKSSRLDIINSELNYLGSGIVEKAQAAQHGGGVYGVSWRIPQDKAGKDIATGWVENSTFSNNYFGAYTFGASGMYWGGNRFIENKVYGLDPHDDSNNFLVENNLFANNGKHGFIISKRCNFNIIRNNRSVNNGGHGFMLDQDSVYNLVENNFASGNTDNYVIYDSDFNVIRGNDSQNPHSSGVRINHNSSTNFVLGNTFKGGQRGVYVYDNSNNVLIATNRFGEDIDNLKTAGAKTIVFSRNIMPALGFDLANSDQVIFGPNRLANP